MNKAIFVYMFLFMHVLDFTFWVRVIWINDEIGIIVWLEIIILQSPEKGFRGNFGSILDFLGIPNQSEL